MVLLSVLLYELDQPWSTLGHSFTRPYLLVAIPVKISPVTMLATKESVMIQRRIVAVARKRFSHLFVAAVSPIAGSRMQCVEPGMPFMMEGASSAPSRVLIESGVLETGDMVGA